MSIWILFKLWQLVLTFKIYLRLQILTLTLEILRFLRVFGIIIRRLLKNESLTLEFILLSFILWWRCHIDAGFCGDLRARHRVLILPLKCRCQYIILRILIVDSLSLSFFRLFTIIWCQVLLLKIVLYSSTKTVCLSHNSYLLA